MKSHNFFEQAEIFLQNLFDQLQAQKIHVETYWQIDHLCFRVGTNEEYESYKKDFLDFGHLLIESEVNGRLISTFKLETPVLFKSWMIDIIELPAPKKGKECNTGFEHIEVVIDIPFAQIKKQNPVCQFDESGLQKIFNQELEIKLQNCAIKFHHLTLLSVVQLEGNGPIYQAINKLKILSNLKMFSPLIAGTFPLDITVADSDLDILLKSDDFEFVTDLIGRHYDQFQDFRKTRILVHGQDTLIFNFHFQGIAFEIFIQDTDTVVQRAYQHFLIEERLLKIGGLKFKDEISLLRKSGLKTELAFAKRLGFEEDPYEDLLAIKNKSELELRQLIESTKSELF